MAGRGRPKGVINRESSKEEIWSTAGTPHAVFKLKPEILKNITNAQIVSTK